MPWFRLEDSFHLHPKVTAAGNAATGLWVRCATYSAQYLTDGAVTDEVAHSYGNKREIDRLVGTGMWIRNGSGFLIPDYLEYNPSAAQVRKDRELARERQAKRRRNMRGEYE